MKATQVCLTGSAVEVAAMASKMGSFSWKFVEYKGQNGFVVAFLPEVKAIRRVTSDIQMGARQENEVTHAAAFR